MGAVLDVAGTQATGTAATSLTYTGITVGSGNNRALVVAISWLGDPGAITTNRWDDGGTNQNVTTIIAPTANVNGQRTALFGLINPISGNKTYKIIWTNASEYGANLVSWTGVNQSGGTTSFPNATTTTGNNNAPSITITLPNQGAGVSSIATGTAASILSVSATQLYLVHGVGSYEGGGSYSTSSGTFSGVLATTDQWIVAATGIAQFVADTARIPVSRPFPWRPGTTSFNFRRGGF